MARNVHTEYSMHTTSLLSQSCQLYTPNNSARPIQDVNVQRYIRLILYTCVPPGLCQSPNCYNLSVVICNLLQLYGKKIIGLTRTQNCWIRTSLISTSVILFLARCEQEYVGEGLTL